MTVAILCKSCGVDESIQIVANIRRYTVSLKHLAPLSSWVHALLDYLEGKPTSTTRYVSYRVPSISYVHYKAVLNKLPINFVALDGDVTAKLNQATGYLISSTPCNIADESEGVGRA